MSRIHVKHKHRRPGQNGQNDQSRDARPQASAPAADAKNQSPPPRPEWLPAGWDLDRLSPESRRAAVTLLEPMHRQLVLDEPDSLARSIGSTLLHLTWLELLDQAEFGREACKASYGYRLDELPSVGGILERCMKTASAKAKLGNFLLRLRSQRGETPKAPPLAQHVVTPPDPPARKEEGGAKREEGAQHVVTPPPPPQPPAPVAPAAAAAVKSSADTSEPAAVGQATATVACPAASDLPRGSSESQGADASLRLY